MKYSRILRTLLIVALAVLGGQASFGAPEDFKIVRAGDLEWQTAEGFDGLEFALIEGDPAKEGIYVMRAKFAPGVFSRPHFHSSDRLVTVISGVWYAGTDASFDRDRAIALYPGDFMKHPAGAIHYDGAKDVETIVEIRGIGPVTTTPVEIAK